MTVFGGGGVLGRLVVSELRRRGHDVEVASRSTGVDAVGGTGVAQAVRGADAVVDCTNVQTASAGKAIAGFGAIATHLSAAVLAEGVPHLVAVSIVGVHDPTLQKAAGYYRGKAEQERVLAASGAPVTVVRSTQWFELARTFLQGRIGPVALVPRMRSQPVAGSVVADLVADIVEAGFTGRTGPAIAGPEVRDLADLAKAIARREGSPRFVVAFPVPGAGRLFEAGALIPGPETATDGPTFEQWLAQQSTDRRLRRGSRRAGRRVPGRRDPAAGR